jgi:TadE-like protein
VARGNRPSGQALAEFALIVPVVLVLLIVVGDFARLFATSIAIESAARDAAEVAAQEYLRNPPGATPPAGYYDGSSTSLHQQAATTVCNELGSLPNAGSNCGGIPVVACVHDGADTGCSTLYPSGVTVPSQCRSLSSGLPTNGQNGGTETSKWVEVRVCYRFSTLLNISSIGPIALPFGDFYLERTRVFTVADY